MRSSIPCAVIFDMDGTLFRTEEVAIPAFKKTFQQLKKEGLFEGEVPSDNKLTSVFGMTLKEIWDELLPGCADDVKEKADQIMLREEMKALKEGKASLYPEVKETLSKLKERGVSLFVASNGLEEYIKAVCDHFQITDWFEDLYSAGRFQTDSKVQLVAKLLADYSIEKGAMVGDRDSDIEAGKENDLFTVGCAFGFSKKGELANADVIVDRFSDVFSVVEQHLRF